MLQCCNIVVRGGAALEKTINFKVDEELYKQIKIKTVLEGKTLKDYIINLIKKDLEEKK